MSTNRLPVVGCILAAMVLGLPDASAAKKRDADQAPVSESELNSEGKKLLGHYSDEFKALQAEIEKAVPKVDEQQKAAFMKAYQEEAAAMVAERKTMLASAKSKDKEAAAKAHQAAKEALELATKNALAPTKAVLADVDKFLKINKLDANLVKYTVLAQATPQGLAEFAQQGKEQQTLVEKLLADNDLMKQMVVAGGAAGGKYGQAMKIYTDIQKASPGAKDGLLQRFALGISLEHAVPVGQRNPEAQTDGPATVDPVKRFLHFEKAFLAGELDPAFKDLTVWDYRYVSDGDESDEVLAWGREMLKNYHPDQIDTPDYRWRYVEAVKTDVKYGSQDQKNDLPTLGFYQNIINTGGICGRRAFFGRFILRSFGVPTLARPQPGHATLVHWTPAGWVINLGANWGWGTVDGNADTDFLAMTQARMAGAAYLEVLRAQWVGAALGEGKTYGFHSPATGFWNGVALYRQRAVVSESKAVTLAAVGTDIGEANESKEKEVIKVVTVSEEDRKISIAPDGVITIPGVACSKPTKNTGKIRFTKSSLGGLQLHYGRLGGPETFEYTFDAPAAGNYTISARAVTVSPDQHLLVTANDSKEAVDIAVPYTMGKWEQTQPVEIAIAKGKNVLHFSRDESSKGISIKDFTLAPLK